MMYYHVRLTPKGEGIDDEVRKDLSRQEIEERFLTPYRNGDPITINGKTISMDELERIKITKSAVDSSQLRRVMDLGPRETSVLGLKPGSTPDSWRAVDEETDVTNDLIVGQPGRKSDANERAVQEPRPSQDTRKVFVVHGRNEQARKALFSFLKALGLHPLEWSEVTQATGKPTPYIGDILDVAFSRAHAVVVLFTPDDEAKLKEHLWGEREHDYETALAGQARPNVLFEAGMAMGRNSERTVLVELGNLRPFSDISGLHVVRLDNNTLTWKELANRLKTAGCPVNWDGIDWQSAGDFEAAIASVVQEPSESAANLEPQSVSDGAPSLSEEARELLAEAAADENGWIRVSDETLDLIVRAGRKDFGRRGRRCEAKLREAMEELVEQGLIQVTSGNGRVFKVTDRGYELDDGLRVPT